MNFNSLKTSILTYKKEIFLLCLLILSIAWLKEINYLFYETLESPDFDKYRIYLDYFFTGSEINKEHGLMYYYLHSLNYSIFYGELYDFNFNIHKSVQNMNFYIFLFGLLGYYLLLSFFKFSKITILITFIFINFFPPIIAMRLVFKPEILAFALLPWIIFLIEKFKKEKNIALLYFAIPLFISAITLKGNVLVIIGVFLLLNYYSLFFDISLKNILPLIIFALLSFLVLTVENNSANGKNILDIQSGSAIEENYNYKASRSIIYNIDLYEIVTNPNKHNHADSFIGITLLETTGDYFDLYWDNDGTEFFKNRTSLIQTIESNEIKLPTIDFETSSILIYKQRNSDRYSRSSLGLIISIFLYFHLIKLAVQSKEYRKFLIFAFVAMGALLFHSITGFPKNNFDPLVGDTFKPLYYSFALVLSFIFLISIKLKEQVLKSWHILIYCIFIVFILGFPKSYNYDLQSSLAPKIQHSMYCSIEKEVYLQDSVFKDLSCNTESIETIEPQENRVYSSNIIHKPINLTFILLNLGISLYLLFFRKSFSGAYSTDFSKN